MVVEGPVTDFEGKPVAGAVIDAWHCNEKGGYSHFFPGMKEHELRRKIVSDANGSPVPLPAPPSLRAAKSPERPDPRAVHRPGPPRQPSATSTSTWSPEGHGAPDHPGQHPG